MNDTTKRPKTGGRKSGSLNKATRAVKEIANEYTESAITTLADIMQDLAQPAAARVSAARELLDRGHGKPTQSVEIDASVTAHKIDLAQIDAELEKAAKIREERQAELEAAGLVGRFTT